MAHHVVCRALDRAPARRRFLRELQQAVWSVNPNLPLAAVQTLDEIQASSMAQTSFAMAMLGIAASVALLLGIVGIYGAIAYIATERTREIGIRMALGAQIGDVRKLFLRQGLWLTATGIALGIAVALALTRVMSALLFGVGPTDPLTYVAVSGALAPSRLPRRIFRRAAPRASTPSSPCERMPRAGGVREVNENWLESAKSPRRLHATRTHGPHRPGIARVADRSARPEIQLLPHRQRSRRGRPPPSSASA